MNSSNVGIQEIAFKFDVVHQSCFDAWNSDIVL